MQDNDIVAEPQEDGRFIIRRWSASDNKLMPVEGHEDSYEEAEMYRRLGELRPTGDTYVRERSGLLRLVQP